MENSIMIFGLIVLACARFVPLVKSLFALEECRVFKKQDLENAHEAEVNPQTVSMPPQASLTKH